MDLQDVGKTSLAKVISETTQYKFYKINAVTAGVADIKAVIEETKNFMLNPTGKAILFIDEIHRFNKLQQDALLPYVENGTIILIGATTENPYFEVNKALISRSMVVKLEPLDEEDILKVLKMALTKKEGLGEYNIHIEEKTLKKLSTISNGDVRTALNALEVAVLTTTMDKNGTINKVCLEKETDKNGKKTCTNEEILNNACNGGSITNEQFNELYNEIIKKYMNNETYFGQNTIILTENVVFQIAKLDDQKNSNNKGISNIDLGDCEQKLKQYYSIKDEESLIIYKQDIKTDNLATTYVLYKIYHPYTLRQLNLSI